MPGSEIIDRRDHAVPLVFGEDIMEVTDVPMSREGSFSVTSNMR